MYTRQSEFNRKFLGLVFIFISTTFLFLVLDITNDVRLRNHIGNISLPFRNLDDVKVVMRDINSKDYLVDQGAGSSIDEEKNHDKGVNTKETSTISENKSSRNIISFIRNGIGDFSIHGIYIILFLLGISSFGRPKGFSRWVKGIGILSFLFGLMIIEGSIFCIRNSATGSGGPILPYYTGGQISHFVGEYVGIIVGVFISIIGFFLALDWLAVILLYKLMDIGMFFGKLLYGITSKLIVALIWVFKFMVSEVEDEEGDEKVSPDRFQQMEIDFASNSESSVKKSTRAGLEFPENKTVSVSKTSVLPNFPDVECVGNEDATFNQGSDEYLKKSDTLVAKGEIERSCVMGNAGNEGIKEERTLAKKVSLVREERPIADKERDSSLEGFGSTSKESSLSKNDTLCYSEQIPVVNGEEKIYTKPPIELFDSPPPGSKKGYSQVVLESMAKQLEETLERFGAKAKVVSITCGPSVTRFELIPDPNVRVNKFQALADDITLALKVDRVRVEAPIPGKGKVGVEVPNKERENVWIRELLEDEELLAFPGRLKVPLGKDVTGKVRVVDIAKMPHLLIAGSTGSGKTVFTKQILVSLLCQYTPSELKVVLIDPKRVEFSVFDGIPHLLMPVISEPKEAVESLSLLVGEMHRRYELLAQNSVNNIEVYNNRIENGEVDLFKFSDKSRGLDSGDTYSGKLPYIVCVIDELADLLILQKNLVETSIVRLSQLARAVGIHLVVATQRPSVDIMKGLIKANFPVRISFRVSSKADSQCILDSIGGEKLIGNGDMLYYNGQKPVRIQGAYVSEREILALVDFLKKQGSPEYINSNSISFINSASQEEYGDDDPLYEEAVRIVLKERQASVSLLQRKLRIGYARAGHLIDLMERRGIVGPYRGSKPREILLTPDEIRKILRFDPTDMGEDGEDEGETPLDPVVVT
ncbi:MAG: DNA translocase FtsK [Candidatus Hydrogenedentes bacterium]|nr:DNA translocase FtsK [Candidatus Hydrogenedentota bacterium]